MPVAVETKQAIRWARILRVLRARAKNIGLGRYRMASETEANKLYLRAGEKAREGKRQSTAESTGEVQKIVLRSFNKRYQDLILSSDEEFAVLGILDKVLDGP